jgi:dipeptidyl aminopeptidase/acylaminoacyl peptidase
LHFPRARRNIALHFWDAMERNNPMIRTLKLFAVGVFLAALVGASIGHTQTRHKQAVPAATPDADADVAPPQSPPAPAAAPAPELPASVQNAMHAMFDVREFRQVAISPDAKHVAWVESLPGKNGALSPNFAIYVANTENAANPRRISAGTGDAAEHDVAWSPDSTRLAFLSDSGSPGQLQLCVAVVARPPVPKAAAKPAAGAHRAALKTAPAISAASAPLLPVPAVRPMTKLKGFLATPKWSPDGKTIAILFTQNAARAASPLVAEAPAVGVIAEDIHEQRLTLIDEKTGAVRQLSPLDLNVYEYDWSPDGKQLVVTAAHGSGDDNWYLAQLAIVDIATAATETILEPSMQIAFPRWSPDGSSIAFIGGLMSDEGSVGGDIYTVPAAGGEAKGVSPNATITPSSLYWQPDSKTILFGAVTNGQAGIGSLDLASGTIHPLWEGAETISSEQFGVGLSLAADGESTAIVRQSFQHPPEVWAGHVGGWKQVTHRNEKLESAWGSAESLNWTSDAFTIQGWLIYPDDYDSSKIYPLVVVPHGGPASAVTPSWPGRARYFGALPAAGYFVLEPNPRGSYGQGEAFTRANVKDFGYGDFRDIMAGIDAATKAATIDTNRIGITGWSYGGYMTMWAVTQTNRFRAAVAGAGLANLQSYYGENGIDQWMIPYFGASVYDDPGVYARSSPITFIQKARTPTLVIVGERDGECPAPQSYEFWHALKSAHVPSELVVYAGEGHHFADPAHSRDVIARAISWFQRFL